MGNTVRETEWKKVTIINIDKFKSDPKEKSITVEYPNLKKSSHSKSELHSESKERTTQREVIPKTGKTHKRKTIAKDDWECKECKCWNSRLDNKCKCPVDTCNGNRIFQAADSHRYKKFG